MRLYARDIIDPEMEAHYRFRSMASGPEPDGRITTQQHDHDFYELFLITGGRVCHMINGREELAQEGDLAFIRPRDRHSFRQIDDADCQMINLAFPAHTIAALFTYLGDGFDPERLTASEQPPVVRLQRGEQVGVVARLEQLNNIPPY